ncbi:molybdopterin molybdotransferase MoeA [Alkaliphilus oremlandii]|uniref:Molybdopterin molybdenumtransferase n=1 Tax=Alkaliphilus oremlandii (strain OhILAs) TaxID=350688 RepID=A8MKW6_ALKOO|nr:molybdopterin molybdotransferase MoeA [Alkaliphilus oremlandii]ABW17783.1 molybdenum cofactor synthesis domain [Alkaliphilus oremlandii OhILAs]
MKEHKVVVPSREEYIELATSLAKFDRRTEIVSLKESVGRVTAKDIYALHTLPNQPTSAMDGIAVRFEAFTSKEVDPTAWELGKEYVFSNTGVAIPTEYDTAIPIEHVKFDNNNRLHINKIPSCRGENVVPRGKNMKEGELLVPAEYVITPLQLGVLASGGICEIEVIAKPKVAIIPTGNELVPAGAVLPLGKNIETNSIVLEALIKEWGGEPIVYPIIPDDPVYIYDILYHALKQSDMVIFNGGSSKGTHDFGKEILGKIGQVYAYEVAHGPGKHTSLTVAGNKLIVGLVGPPGGTELTAPWYVKPLINKYLCKPDVQAPKLEVKLLNEISSSAPFDFYIQLIVSQQDGEYVATRIKMFNATRAQLAVQANAILCVPRGVVFKKGETVAVELKIPIEYISA